MAHNSFSDLFKRYQAYTLSNELYLLIAHARSYALTNHRSLTLCGSSNGEFCNNDWTSGALLFEDPDRDGVLDNYDAVIQFHQFNLKKANLTWKGFNDSKIIFESMGITYASNGTFTYCQLDKNPQYSRQVIINRGARARKSFDANGDGIHENSSGQPINCP